MKYFHLVYRINPLVIWFDGQPQRITSVVLSNESEYFSLALSLGFQILEPNGLKDDDS